MESLAARTTPRSHVRSRAFGIAVMIAIALGPTAARADDAPPREPMNAGERDGTTIVLDIRDATGQVVTDATVAIDGDIVTREDDGSIAVAPGAHELVVQHGGERKAETITVGEQPKRQTVRVQFGGGGIEAAGREPGGHTVWPWAVVALGGAVAAAGVAIAVTAPPLPAGCDADTRRCAPLPSETQQAFEQRQADADSDQGLVGLAIAGGGVLVAGAGLLWHLLEPVRPRANAAPHFAPWLASGSGGLSAIGRF